MAATAALLPSPRPALRVALLLLMSPPGSPSPLVPPHELAPTPVHVPIASTSPSVSLSVLARSPPRLLVLLTPTRRARPRQARLPSPALPLLTASAAAANALNPSCPTLTCLFHARTCSATCLPPWTHTAPNASLASTPTVSVRSKAGVLSSATAAVKATHSSLATQTHALTSLAHSMTR